MAAVMLAPRPSPQSIGPWSGLPQTYALATKDRPALKQLQQTTIPRGRRERPCDGCRRRKSKCVQQENRKCVLCEFHKQDCTFIENAQPRKRKLEEPSKKESPAKRSPLLTQPSSPSRPSTSQTDAAAVKQPLPPVQPFSSIVDDSLSLQRHRHCRYIGQTTALDASIIGLGDFSNKNESCSHFGTLRRIDDNEYFSTFDDAEVPIPDDEARALAEIEQIVSPHGPALIDIYFRNVHPSFPIIQKHAFVERQKNNDMQFNPPLLAAMYLLAITWWTQEPAVANSPLPDITRLEYVAITSLTISMQRPKMSAVQAGLLLSQLSRLSTWPLTVQLVALGQEIGLHLDCSRWTISSWEKRLRKRLAWALYMQDKWSAVVNGRPTHISTAEWNVAPLIEEDFDDGLISEGVADSDELTLQGRDVFMQMITLTTIMSEVCETFYSENAKSIFANAGRNATQLVLKRAKPVQIKLKDWFTQLPQHCKIDSWAPGQRCPNGYLHLAYFAAEMSIHRRIVQSLDPATADPYLLFICRSAAKTRLISAMDVVNRLKSEHLSAFWYFASATNFALIGTFGALLQASSPAGEEATFYACRLSEFGWTLRVSAKKAPWLQFAVDSLAANAAMLEMLPSKPSSISDEPSPENDSHTGEMDQY
ncbi:hypothetical protein AMS68_000937 [Peltaster fructicola]|uniref:Zn(2)-C6 fungal-type domain-containing protein n=1 Tax=Peltaster fructicola TaxID=286661 RepID=A0A6H0XLN7_9PEZI|nr:hypothetical protein AMS68_000937 [Peltaster fructicola]